MMKGSVYIPVFLLLLFVQSYFTYGQESSGFIYHIVKSGDNVFRISLYYNVPMDSIKSWNCLDSNYLILKGLKLKIKMRLNGSSRLVIADKLTSVSGSVGVRDTSDNPKNIQTIDSLVIDSQNEYLPLLSESVETHTKSSVYEIILHFYNRANFLIQTIFSCVSCYYAYCYIK